MEENVSTDNLLNQIFNEYQALAFTNGAKETINEFARLALQIKERKAKMMFGGNGASASAAEHGATDFTKQGGVRGVTFHDPNLITCFANDYGYDHWLAKAIEHYADDGDAVVLLSVSGSSPSVVNAAKYAKSQGLSVVAFTGRDTDNPLRHLADIDFWVPSHSYNLVECIHQIWLTAAVDVVIGKNVYETSMKAK